MEYKCKEGMMDNRIVKDSHQEGIGRVLQRKSDMNKEKRVSESGKMGKLHKPDDAHFKRAGKPLTPRKA